MACGILVPRPGIKPMLPGVLTTVDHQGVPAYVLFLNLQRDGKINPQQVKHIT